MKELTLKEIRQIEFELLLNFRAFCEENDISYFLSHGTLLGAVKYKGFIPWDDDIDIFVPRKDYDRLIDIYSDTHRYKLFSVERVPKFGFPFAKLCDMTTIKQEFDVDNGVELGLDIDIFPLDVWPQQKETAICYANKINKYVNKIHCAKLPLKKGKSPLRSIAKFAILLFYKMLGVRHYVDKINKMAKENVGLKKINYMGCITWPIYSEKEVVPVKVFSDKTELEFEGEKFSAPIGYDAYLRSLYGDYEKDPPVDEQKTHHKFKAYKVV